MQGLDLRIQQTARYDLGQLRLEVLHRWCLERAGDVIMLGGDQQQIGSPMITGASVAAEILDHVRGAKVIAFKKRRRKNSRRKRGYRHEFSVIRITEILTGGAKPSKTAAPRPRREPKPQAEAEAATAAEASPKAGKPAKKPAKAAAKKPAKPATKSKKK